MKENGGIYDFDLHEWNPQAHLSKNMDLFD